MELDFILFVVGLHVAVYLLPWLIANMRGLHQQRMIAVINIFLGWTAVGWVVALALACSAVKSDQTNKP